MAKTKYLIILIITLLFIASCGKKIQQAPVVPPPKIEVFFAAYDETTHQRVHSNVTVIQIDFTKKTSYGVNQTHWYTKKRIVNRTTEFNKTVATRLFDITNNSDTAIKLDANMRYHFWFEPDGYNPIDYVFDLGNATPTYNFVATMKQLPRIQAQFNDSIHEGTTQQQIQINLSGWLRREVYCFTYSKGIVAIKSDFATIQAKGLERFDKCFKQEGAVDIFYYTQRNFSFTVIAQNISQSDFVNLTLVDENRFFSESKQDFDSGYASDKGDVGMVNPTYSMDANSTIIKAPVIVASPPVVAPSIPDESLSTKTVLILLSLLAIIAAILSFIVYKSRPE